MVNLSLVKYGRASHEHTAAASKHAPRASLHDKPSSNLVIKLLGARHVANTTTRGENHCLPSTPDFLLRLSHDRSPLKLRHKALSHVYSFSPPANSVEHCPATEAEQGKKGVMGFSSEPDTSKIDMEQKHPTWAPETRPKSLRLKGMVPPGSEQKKAREENKLKIPKFSVALMRSEIEKDIFAMTGSRPSRRPQKRPRHVQKQLDESFPGLLLSSITLNSYKVVEAPHPR